MSEVETPAETVWVVYTCDDENCLGTMKATGMSLLSIMPPQYPHVCDKCGATANLGTVYPTFRSQC